MMPQAAPNMVVAPVAARGCLALVCAGAVWLLNVWLFSAGVATLVIARAACGENCPAVLVYAAAAAAVTAVALGFVCSVAMLLLFFCVLDSRARQRMAAATREALDVGRTVLMLGKVASVAFASVALVAFVVKVYPPLKRWERISSVALDAGAVCMGALCCFVVLPTFAIRMWRRV